mmetsp:Transcript_5761/g.13400  ORF Transcript_5761/g.13400 Transcript_5761/m.13400 type:complete len:347 (+) Transcript_5761:705-1745(+)
MSRIPHQRHVHSIVRQSASERAPVVVSAHCVEDDVKLRQPSALEEESIRVVPGFVCSQRLDEVHVPLRAAGDSVAVKVSLCKLNSKAPDPSASSKDEHRLVALLPFLQQVSDVSKSGVSSETSVRHGSSLIVREVGGLESDITAVHNAVLGVRPVQLPHTVQSLTAENFVSDIEGRIFAIPHDPAAEVYPKDARESQGTDGGQRAFPLLAICGVDAGGIHLHYDLRRLQLPHGQSRQVAQLRLEQSRAAIVRKSHRQHLRRPLREVHDQRGIRLARDRPGRDTALHELEGVGQSQRSQEPLFVHLLLGGRASCCAHARGKAHFSHVECRRGSGVRVPRRLLAQSSG